MKKTLCLIALALAVIMMCGCIKLPKLPFGGSDNSSVIEQTSQPESSKETESVDSSKEETSSEPESSETQSTFDGNYLQQVNRFGSYIFKTPSYDGRVVQPMPTGTFTIVDEKNDDEGNLWGKLKSGLGWICLTEIRGKSGIVAIGEVDAECLAGKNYTTYGEKTGYTKAIAVQCTEAVKNASFGSVDYMAETSEIAYPLISGVDLKKGSITVFYVEFTGDLTTYGFSFYDKNGKYYFYLISESGRNGTVGAYLN